ncbi:MAG: nuclear transport factor 2 family protein [Candidatus Baltobacteraceae bacterium]
MIKFASLSCILATVAFGLAGPAQASPAGLNAAMMLPITRFVAATNADRASGFDGYFTDDAVVVDNFAPYEWTTANAGHRWWSEFRALRAKIHFGNIHVAAQPITQFTLSAFGAYVVVPLEISFTIMGKPHRQTGLQVFTLRLVGTEWKIATATWGTLTRN